jgi:ComF family protein
MIRPVIASFKYRKRAELAEPLAHMLAEKLRATQPHLNPSTTVLIPIPMHPKKERERGYNQAELLATALEKETGITLIRDTLLKHDYHNPQALQPSKENRIENMRNSLSVSSDIETLVGKTIILVDDVVTTGATMTAAAQALRAKNPARIIGLAVAH